MFIMALLGRWAKSLGAWCRQEGRCLLLPLRAHLPLRSHPYTRLHPGAGTMGVPGPSYLPPAGQLGRVTTDHTPRKELGPTGRLSHSPEKRRVRNPETCRDLATAAPSLPGCAIAPGPSFPRTRVGKLSPPCETLRFAPHVLRTTISRGSSSRRVLSAAAGRSLGRGITAFLGSRR